jgi:hypothetical protein
MRSLTLAPLTALTALTACGGDVDLSGVYRVDSSVSSSPCGADVPDPTPPAFLSFSRGDFLGSDFFSYAECTDAAATDCRASGGLLEGFFEPRDAGWFGYASFASGPDGSCSLGLDERSATLDGSTLTIESHSYRQDDVDAPCQPAEAEVRGHDMPCTSHSLIVARRL